MPCPATVLQQDYDELGQRTEGFSGSDIAVVVKDVLMQPVRKTQVCCVYVHCVAGMLCLTLWSCFLHKQKTPVAQPCFGVTALGPRRAESRAVLAAPSAGGDTFQEGAG